MTQQIGRYEIIRELGRGSMGVVYAAIDPLIGRMVAIKTIRLDGQGSEENRAELTRRLYREAQSAGILSHPGIITIHDIGERAHLAYIVMEYVSGMNLEDLLSSGVPQHSDTLFSILRQAATALDYAHDKGIIHRDIKPSNIMICPDGVVKIADFGVAKLSASASMTQAGLVLGTPSYMSPEQAQGLEISGRTDQFSLGVVAYRVLTGVLPFQGPTLTALLTRILMEEPQYENSGMSALLQPVFRRVLAKNPLARFQDCAAFVRELESAYASCRVAAAGLPPGAKAPDTTPANIKDVLTTAQPPTSDMLPEAAAPVAGRAVDGEEMDTPPPPPAEKSGKKPSVLAWVACLGILALVAIAFFSYQALRQSRATDQDLQTQAAATAAANRQQSSAANSVRSEAAPLNEQPAKPIPAPKQAASEKANAPAPKQMEATGSIQWTGKLDKNSILVIGEGQASVGSIVGELPGIPVVIDLDPGELLVRQMPGPENQWKQIILYSGPNKYKSITIHWKARP